MGLNDIKFPLLSTKGFGINNFFDPQDTILLNLIPFPLLTCQMRTKVLNTTLPGPKDIPFNQSVLINSLNQNDHGKLLKIIDRVGGLCDLICNFVLQRDLLGKGNDPTFLTEKITVSELNQEHIKKSHILDIYSIFRKIIAYLFGVYPNNILSCFDQWKLIKKVSNKNVIQKNILEQGLQRTPDGEMLKLQIFGRENYQLTGHSCLVKKLSNDCYILFDPGKGERRDVTFNELCDALELLLNENGRSDMALIRGSEFLKKWNP